MILLVASLGVRAGLGAITSRTAAQSQRTLSQAPGSRLGVVRTTNTITTDTLHVPVALWDSLWAQQQYVTLQNVIHQWHGPATPIVQYFRGMLARTRNDPDAAITLLKPLADSLPRELTVAQLCAVTDALAESYRDIYRYREFAETYRTALRHRGLVSDSAVRAIWQQQARFADALHDVLPQHVTWISEARRDTIPNGGIRYAAQVRANGVATARLFRIDLGTSVTTLDSTTAAAYGVRTLLDRVQVSSSDSSGSSGSSDGMAIVGRLGVIASLGIGAATISHVVVLVIPDQHGVTSSGDGPALPPVAGVLGRSVLNGLGQITFTLDGHVALSSPGIAGGEPDATNDSASAIRFAFAVSPRGAIGRATGRTTPIIYMNHRGLPYLIGRDPVSTIHAALASDTSDVPESGASQAHSQNGQAVYGVTLNFATMMVSLQRPQPPPILPTITYPEDTPPTRAHDTPTTLPEDLVFVALLFALFVIPKALQRYRIPSAVTSLLMGAVASGFGLFQHDPTLHLLSTFGIVALFLFAGLEIDGDALRQNTSALLLHSALWSGLVIIAAAVAVIGCGVALRPALLIGLALLTPSTGFILSSLPGFGLHATEQVAVKTYAVGSELLALGVLFFILQSTSFAQLTLSLAAIVGVVIVIPLAFRFFATVVAPHAPRSEFAFLLMVAVVCAYATRRLGVYYLVGAFLVGIAAQRFRAHHPAMSSERMVDALESFGSVFIPFYFFRAGTQIVGDQFTPSAIGIGLLLAVICIPLRIGMVALHRRRALGESWRTARRIGATLVPTLVFTLVLADILHTQFALSDTAVGALVLYTILNTVLPAFVLHGMPPEFEHVEAQPVDGALNGQL